MITYNPAFDLYHTIYRMAHILQKMDDRRVLEIDQLRIWDFYWLYPVLLNRVSLKFEEKEIREARKRLNLKETPFDYKGDIRKLFEWVKPFQISALACLVSCGILKKAAFETGYVLVADSEKLHEFVEATGSISDRESEILNFLSFLFAEMPLTGIYGMKYRTKLLESKYDA
jgi:hypothetical protein